MNVFPQFQIIQGGMGVGVSGWRLARAVAEKGELGVVSGTALDLVLARTLQLGDPDGHLRRALQAFPLPAVAQRIVDTYFIEGGKAPDRPFAAVPIPNVEMSDFARDLTIAGAFAATYLAKEGHRNPVGINLLEKIQIPILPTLFGAMLAGVDVVLMGAGIPRQIPGILDHLAAGREAMMRLDVPECEAVVHLDPRRVMGDAEPPVLRRPAFIAIVSSHVLAKHLAEKCESRVDGFVVEMPTAGGHNAPPRGAMKLDALGEPVYGPRDEPDLNVLRALGRPFWLAGGFGRSGALRRARSMGAQGVQVGTLFAFCDESGLDSSIKSAVIERARRGSLRVFTDPFASPTGFPFKVVQLPGSIADDGVYKARERLCDVGMLRQGYRKASGLPGFRCPAEPEDHYEKKGGAREECAGRMCLCNGLLSAIGLAQVRPDGTPEPPLVTAGDDAERLLDVVSMRDGTYRAADVIEWLRAV